jgi:predicted membrane protein
MIAVGLGLSAEAMGWWNFGALFSTWWPLIVIAYGLLELLSPNRERLIPVLIIGAGMIFLGNRLGYWNISLWQLIWPVIMIVVGISWLLQASRAPRVISERSVDLFTAFAGQTHQVTTAEFEGGHITTWFGGTKLDLRRASIKHDATLVIFAAFGGVELLVPKDWQIELRGTPIFGGWEDKTENTVESAKKLHVLGTVAFGGIEVKN